MNKTETIQKLNALVKEAKKTKVYTELEEFCLSPEYQQLEYRVKNKPFITSSKIHTFRQCELWYKLKFVDMLEPEYDESEDYFTIGQALDDLLTYGQEFYDRKYVTVDRRVNDFQAEFEKQHGLIQKARNTFLKDGVTRSKPSLTAEMKADIRIKELKIIKEKTQMTNSMEDTVRAMADEYRKQPLFSQNLTKRVFFHEHDGELVKVELDHFDEENGVVEDVKSTANIERFACQNYVNQLCVYRWVLQANGIDLKEVKLNVVDKWSKTSRSKQFIASDGTLESEMPEILAALDRLKLAEKSGMYSRTDDESVIFKCPYYGHEAYGRITQPTYF